MTKFTCHIYIIKSEMRRLKEKFGQPEQAAPITLKYTRRRDPDQTLQSQQRIFYKIGTKTIDITTWLSDCLSAKSIYIALLKMSMLLQFPVNFQGHKTTCFNSKVHWIARNSFLIKAAWLLRQMPIDQSHQAHACMVSFCHCYWYGYELGVFVSAPWAYSLFFKVKFHTSKYHRNPICPFIWVEKQNKKNSRFLLQN